MDFETWVEEIAAIFEASEDLLERVYANDLAIAVASERELASILNDLAAEVEYVQVGRQLRVKPSQVTKRAARRAQRRLETWRQETLAAFRATAPASFLASGKKLSEMRALYRQAIERTIDVLRGFSRSGSAYREAALFSREMARVRKVYGPSLSRYFDGVLSEAEFGKVENLAGGIGQGYREPRNFLERWTAGTPGGRIGVLRSQEAEPMALNPLRAFEASKADMANFLRDWRFNRNQLRLSSTAHGRGMVNAVIIRTFQALGVSHFMHWVPPRHRKPSGFSAEQLYTVRLGEPDGSFLPLPDFCELTAIALGISPEECEREMNRRADRSVDDTNFRKRREVLGRMLHQAEGKTKTWPDVFREMSKGRVSTVPWAGGLSLHHNSKEYFMPVPPSMLGEARQWKKLRKAA